LANSERIHAEEDLLARMRSLQERMVPVLQTLPRRAKDLREELRRILQKAIRAEVLKTPPDIATRKLLKLVSSEESRKVKELGGTHGILGAHKDFDRISVAADATERLVREDGAVIHFTLTVKESAGPLELIAYDFELYYPSKQPIWFIRFDMNQPGHKNEDLGLRSHVHPGHEDLLVPGVVLSPAEALSFLLFGFQLRRRA
jgi:hypothetical protein